MRTSRTSKIINCTEVAGELPYAAHIDVKKLRPVFNQWKTLNTEQRAARREELRQQRMQPK